MNTTKLHLVERTAQQPGLLDRSMIEQKMQQLGIQTGYWYVREGSLYVRWAEQDFRIMPYAQALELSYQQLADMLDATIQAAIIQRQQRLRKILVQGIQSGKASEWKSTLEQLAHQLGVPTQSLEFAL